MKRISLIGSFLALALLPAVAGRCATVTPQVVIRFDGTLSGATYNLAPGELDNSMSFKANGSATVAGGAGDIPGNLDPANNGPGNVAGVGPTTGSGFYFDTNGLGLGPITDLFWSAEALVHLDSLPQDQPATSNYVLDVLGETFFRFSGSPKGPKTGYRYLPNNPANESESIVNEGMISNPVHIGLIWNPEVEELRAFVNGEIAGVALSVTGPQVSSSLVGFGFYAGFFNRSIDGQLDAAAFSTFDRNFDPQTDFIFKVPEPSTAALVALAAMPFVRRRRTRATR